jgi:glycogen debranching enzyme
MLHLDLILKNNELCLVGQARKRIAPDEVGLYLRDTRFLSRLDIAFGGEELRILEVQTTTPDTVVITATNPPLHTSHGSAAGDTLTFRIEIRLSTVMTCTITVQNFGEDKVNSTLELTLAADFKDMFAVRGMTNDDPAACQPPQVSGSTAILPAIGADGATVSTRVTIPEIGEISSLDDLLAGSTMVAAIPVSLGHLESATHAVEIAPEPIGAPLQDASSFDEDAGYTARHSLRTPSTWINEFVAQCDADLALLQTSFPDGNIPAAGIPWYVAPFGRDSLIVALQTMHLYPVRSEHTLRVLAALQGTKHDSFTEEAPGKILHEMRYGDMARREVIPHRPYYGSVDSTSLFVMTFARHYLWHRDDALYDALIDNVHRALSWMETDGDPDGDGLLEFSGRQLDRTHISQQGWKDSFDSLHFADGREVEGPIALVEVQGYAYAAYAWLAHVARIRGEATWADELQAKAERVRQRVEDTFWMDDAGFYAQALDGQKRPVDAISSNPGHLLFCGLPTPQRAAAVAHRLAQPDMNSGWGIRTLSSEMATYNPVSYHNGSIWPHDVSLTMVGLNRYGHRDLAVEQAFVLSELARRDPERRIAELYCGFGGDESPAGPVNYPRTCLPQAWAAGAGILAAAVLLGIDLDDDGRLAVNPNMPADWDTMEAHGIQARGKTYSVRADRGSNDITVHLTEE